MCCAQGSCCKTPAMQCIQWNSWLYPPFHRTISFPIQTTGIPVVMFLQAAVPSFHFVRCSSFFSCILHFTLSVQDRRCQLETPFSGLLSAPVSIAPRHSYRSIHHSHVLL